MANNVANNWDNIGGQLDTLVEEQMLNTGSRYLRSFLSFLPGISEEELHRIIMEVNDAIVKKAAKNLGLNAENLSKEKAQELLDDALNFDEEKFDENELKPGGRFQKDNQELEDFEREIEDGFKDVFADEENPNNEAKKPEAKPEPTSDNGPAPRTPPPANNPNQNTGNNNPEGGENTNPDEDVEPGENGQEQPGQDQPQDGQPTDPNGQPQDGQPQDGQPQDGKNPLTDGWLKKPDQPENQDQQNQGDNPEANQNQGGPQGNAAVQPGGKNQEDEKKKNEEKNKSQNRIKDLIKKFTNAEKGAKKKNAQMIKSTQKEINALKKQLKILDYKKLLIIIKMAAVFTLYMIEMIICFAIFAAGALIAVIALVTVVGAAFGALVMAFAAEYMAKFSASFLKNIMSLWKQYQALDTETKKLKKEITVLQDKIMMIQARYNYKLRDLRAKLDNMIVKQSKQLNQ